MADFFTETVGVPIRWYSGASTAWHGWPDIQILSDLGVGTACLAIPLILGFFIIRRRYAVLALTRLGSRTSAMHSPRGIGPEIADREPMDGAPRGADRDTALIEGVIRRVPVGDIVAEANRGRMLTSNQEAEPERSPEDEGQFRALADNIPQLAWMTRPDGSIFWYNRRWYEYTGATSEAMHGWGWQAVHDPAELPRVLAKFRAHIVSGEPWEDTFPLRRHDGAYRWHLSRAMPERDEQGRIVQWFGTNTDISEQRELTRALTEADRLKDEFLATVAHELRNPLAPIRYAVQILGAGNLDVPDLAWCREVIERQIGQMARLLDDLLDVSRITRSKVDLRKGEVELANVVERAVEISRPMIVHGGQELAVALPPEPVLLEADPVRLAQVFANLLNNAAKYTDRGGRIRLTAERLDGDVVVSVKDSGIGITPEMLPRLFNIFSQATPAMERSQGGLGIGLSLVKGLVEMHGGTVEARSEGPGRGSEFLVRLPVADDPPLREPRAEEVEASCLARCKILVADDNRDAADSLAMILRMKGNEVRTAYDGRKAVELAEAFRPDLAMLDIGMPGFDGYEAARRIRGESWGKDMMLVALTGWGQEADKRRATEAGFDFHLLKPADPAALERLLGTARPRHRE